MKERDNRDSIGERIANSRVAIFLEESDPMPWTKYVAPMLLGAALYELVKAVKAESLESITYSAVALFASALALVIADRDLSRPEEIE